MKKVLEGELLSLAHRILQMKEKDVNNLLKESKELYEKLLIMKFYQDHLVGGQIKDVTSEQLEDALSAVSISEVVLAENVDRHQMPHDLVEEEYPIVVDSDVEATVLADDSFIYDIVSKIAPEIEEKETLLSEEMSYDKPFITEAFHEDFTNEEEDAELNRFLDEHEAMLKETESKERIEEEARQAELEAARLEEERLEEERLEAARLEEEELLEEIRLEEERLEVVRLEEERLEAVRLEAERLEEERLEAVRLEEERLEAVRLEEERLEAVRLEEERLEAVRLEEERLEAVRLEEERLEAVRLEEERLEAVRLEEERLEAVRLEEERLEAVRLEEERLEAVRLEAERIAAIRLEEERLEKERIETERLEQERIEQARLDEAKAKELTIQEEEEAYLEYLIQEEEKEKAALLQRKQEVIEEQEATSKIVSDLAHELPTTFNSVFEQKAPESEKIESTTSFFFSQETEANTIKEQPKTELDPFFGFDFREVEFVRVEDVEAEKAQEFDVDFIATEESSAVVEEEKKLVEEKIETPNTLFNLENMSVREPKIVKPKSINDIYNTTITVGLNDRIAFEKHLFGNSAEDFNRVLSQLNTVSTFDEAMSLIDHLVKPEYNNWEGKDEYEERFIALVEKRFI